MKKIILAITITFMSFFGLKAQDQIVKTNGDEIFGKVLRVNKSDIIYKKKDNIDGPEYSENISNILFIKFENGEKEVFTTINSSNTMPTSLPHASVKEIVKRKNSVFFEIFGNTNNGLGLNYERKIFSNKNENFLALKLGFSPLKNANTVNLTSTYNIGDGKNFFEVGGGLGYSESSRISGFVTNNSFNFVYFTPTIGYRRQSQSGFLFRTFFTMITDRVFDLYNISNNGLYSPKLVTKYYPSLGVSIGYSF